MNMFPPTPSSTPRNTNLMGLTVGDVLNNGQETAVAYKRAIASRSSIHPEKPSGTTGSAFGGSMLYASVPLDYRGQVQNKWYYPLRLVVWHNQAKKESEVIAVQNHDLTSQQLAGVPVFH